jgi:NAD(P) transhydrogenase subunit alpha
MKIGVVKERRPNEKRCAVSPDTIKKFVGLGAEVVVKRAGEEAARSPTTCTRAAGAKIVPDARAACSMPT